MYLLNKTVVISSFENAAAVRDQVVCLATVTAQWREKNRIEFLHYSSYLQYHMTCTEQQCFWQETTQNNLGKHGRCKLDKEVHRCIYSIYTARTIALTEWDPGQSNQQQVDTIRGGQTGSKTNTLEEGKLSFKIKQKKCQKTWHINYWHIASEHRETKTWTRK